MTLHLSRSVIVGDTYDFNDSGVDWEEFWNDSVLNVYRYNLSFKSTVMTALYR
jgi:hypothetical protein